MRFLTAGESHGPLLTVIVDGLPAGLPVEAAAIDRDLKRRQMGYGRGGRMKIESDAARITGGVRHGRTLGGPVSLAIDNRDFASWSIAMSPEIPPEGTAEQDLRRVTHPRPGHADLAGALKHDLHDARDVLERASARETAARVAAGALAKIFLREMGIKVLGHTVAVGEAALPRDRHASWDEIASIPDDSPLRCVDVAVEASMMVEIDAAQRAKDSVGGAFQIVARGVPPGLGSSRQWDTRLEARLARAVMSIQAIKAVEIGEGVAAASLRGSAVHDEIFYDAGVKRFFRRTNRAGGIEGGMSNGEEIRVTGFMKPLSTLPKPLRTVDLVTKEEAQAVVERTDTCAILAAGVIGEAMVALTIADTFLEKFGGDGVEETRRNLHTYLAQVREF
ncbi:MAG: chorismate synthase [Acidobacteria bacterium]|nr:chorismate synthase [Acidobacteriota bacterium]